VNADSALEGPGGIGMSFATRRKLSGFWKKRNQRWKTSDYITDPLNASLGPINEISPKYFAHTTTGLQNNPSGVTLGSSESGAMQRGLQWHSPRA